MAGPVMCTLQGGTTDSVLRTFIRFGKPAGKWHLSTASWKAFIEQVTDQNAVSDTGDGITRLNGKEKHGRGRPCLHKLSCGAAQILAQTAFVCV